MNDARSPSVRAWLQAALVPIAIAAAIASYWALFDRSSDPADATPNRFPMDDESAATRLPPLAEQELAVREGRSAELVAGAEPVTGRDLTRWSEYEDLRSLSVGAFLGTDEELRVLEKLPSLERVVFHDLPVGDEGASALARIETLRVVNLPRARFGDAGLAELATLPRLELLRFGSPNVTDAGIAKLATAPSLKYLHVISTPLTGEALSSVAKIETLESFYVDGASFSDDAWRELLAARPDLHVHVDDLHLPSDPQRDEPHR